MTDAQADTQPAAYVEQLRASVEEALSAVVPTEEPARLYEPVRYVLAGKGKRLRPVLLLLSAEMFGRTPAEAMPAALAVEVFHNFTLVHDDIMDHARERRGRPTVHERWDVDTAILCGDFMMGLSYELLARLDAQSLPEALRVFSWMVARLCEGQTLDKDFESRADVTVDQYLHMIDCKTGALLRAVLDLGGVIGGASEAQRAHLQAVGAHVGRAFQIQDDLLDLVADDARWGKTVGGDLIEGKKTYVLLRALEYASGPEHEWLARIVAQRGLPPEDVPEARARIERLGVLEEAEKAVVNHTEQATAALARLPGGAAQKTLHWLIKRMQARLF